MSELNEDIDQLFRSVVEPSEMNPSQMVWTTIDNKLDKTQYNKLQIKYGRIFNFSIGISVVVISLVFLILNQNVKKKNTVLENAAITTQPVTAAVVEVDNSVTTAPEINKENNSISSSTENKNQNSVVKNNNGGIKNNSSTVTSKENSNAISSAKNNTGIKQEPSTSSVSNGLPTTSTPTKTAPPANENTLSSTVIVPEKENSTTNFIAERTIDVVKPSVDNASVASSEEGKNNTESKTVTENEKQILPIENGVKETMVNTAVEGGSEKTVTEEIKVLPATASAENNNLIASTTENNVIQTTSPPTTEASLTNEPIVKNEEVLNASLPNSSENKTEEVKINSATNDTASAVKNTNDTVALATTDAANSPLNGLIPLKEFKFYVAGYYSPDKVVTSIINVNSDEKTVDEKNKYSPSTGIKLGYNFNKHWGLNTGIVYSSVSSAFSFNAQITSQDKFTEYGHNDDDDEEITSYSLPTSYGVIKIPVTHSKNHHANGGTPHQNHGHDTTQLSISGGEKMKYISVPLECLYSRSKDRLSCFVSVSVTVNLLVSQKTEIVELGTGTTYNPNIDGLRSAYFSAGLGVGIQYRIWQRLSVFIEPTYRQGITPMNKEVPIKTYPSLFGVSGGLAFHF